METKTRKIGSWLIVLVVFSSLLAACSSGPAKISVTMTDYEMNLSAPSAKAGEITFHIQNNSEVNIHEFVVVKTDTGAGSLPMTADNTVDESQFTPVDEVEDLETGKNADLVVTLEPGHYVLLCNLPNHYMQGMHADFTVTP
jgi:uncharacterized cupredoxin-like copper-binding protein